MAIEFKKTETTPKTYKIGDSFKDLHGNPCIINSIGVCKCIMIRITDGSRWGDGVEVSDIYRISKTEFDKLRFGQEFTPCDFIITEKK